MSQHLISDHLGFTQQFDGTLEDYMIQQQQQQQSSGGGNGNGNGDGEQVLVQRVTEEVFHLEKLLGLDSTSGSIPGPDGTTHME